MHRITFLFALFVLAACADTSPMDRVDRLSLALGTDGAAEPQSDELDRHDIWSVQGVVQAVDDDATFNVVGWANIDPPTAVQVEDDGGQRWWIGVSRIAGQDDVAVSLGDAVVTGSRVSFTFLRERGWAMDNAVAIRDDTALAFAAEEGWAADIGDQSSALLDGIAVRAGAPYGLGGSNDCGRQRAIELELATDDGMDAHRIGEVSDERHGGLSYAFENVGAWDYQGTLRCTDTWGPHPWTLARVGQ